MARDDPDWPRTVELCGKAAQIENRFGPNVSTSPYTTWLADHYPLRGHTRLSVVRSNPSFTLVERWEHIPIPYLETTLQEWTGANVYVFASQIAPDPFKKLPKRFWWPEDYPLNLMIFQSADADPYETTRETKRMVFCEKDDNGRLRFQTKGKPLPFEKQKYYRRRLLADRFNRGIICEYLEALGIDPEATFERRELDDPILFTCDHPGDPLDPYEAEMERYIAFAEPQGWLADY